MALCHHVNLTKGVQVRIIKEIPLPLTSCVPPAETSTGADRPNKSSTPHQEEKEARSSPETGSECGGLSSTTHSGQFNRSSRTISLIPFLASPQSSPAANSYDLLSVCPASDKVFLQACSVLPIDIVTFNLNNKLPFLPKYSQLSQVCNRQNE